MIMLKSGASKLPSAKILAMLVFGIFLAIALAMDFIWAFSSFLSSTNPSALSHLEIARLENGEAPITNVSENGKVHEIVSMKGEASEAGIDVLSERVLSATFADLPAPELTWEKMPSAPVPRLDGYAVQIRNLLYVFAGYGTIDYVHSHVDVYDFINNTWGERFDIPHNMAHSHLGVASDGRHIYIISGQHGPQCRTAVTHAFSVDTVSKKWQSLPPLPAPRYAPATQLWRGRLHVMGGSKENRHTPAVDHWSLPVKGGKALENEWRNEVPIPRGGPHRACIVVNDSLFVIGGQEGDFMAKPGSPIFKCSRRNEVVYGDVYKLDQHMNWSILPPMPKPDSHIECAWVLINNSIVVVGGTTEKHPITRKMTLVGEIFQFNITTLKWYVIGKLPFRVKTTLVGFWDGRLYFTSGQRDRGPDNPQPKKVIGDMWRTKLHLY